MGEARHDLLGAAYREAARAVVAWSFGLKVDGIDVRIEEARGADIGIADHLPLVDQIAVIVAGNEAEHVFDSPADPDGNSDDLRKLIELLRRTPPAQGIALRSKGRERARQCLIAHWAKVIRVAERVAEIHHVDAAGFIGLVSAAA